MIEPKCQCGTMLELPESTVGQTFSCSTCNVALTCVSGESLAEGGGAGDFDAALVVVSGPDRVGEQFFLGGVLEITLGKAEQRHVQLAGGKLVSRAHARLVRVDFGPSRWKVEDTKSTNGTLVNGRRIASHELQHRDVIRIGDYELRFVSTFEAAPAIAAPPPARASSGSTGGPVCPSCSRSLPKGARICVECGIDITTGRALVISKGLDEDDLAIRADTWIRILSWVVPFGLFPIASEAFGTRKPITTWVITIVTLVASLLFMIALQVQDEPSAALLNLMHWNRTEAAADQQQAALLEELDNLERERRQSSGSNQSRELSAEEKEILLQALAESDEYDLPEGVGFRWYQLFTHALLHDPDIIGFFYHLGGNLLFLWVFGMRVNELLGNLKFAIVYPLLAAGSALVDMAATANQPMYPTLGASGAIMGLAGMYFVFFPAQRVHMAIWLRGGALTGWQCAYKLFSMRGVWLLVLWIAYNDLLPMFLTRWLGGDSVAHWAHVGGFLTGVVVALALLLARQADARRGDILSVALGRHAWLLLGRPGAMAAADAARSALPAR